MNPVRIPRHRPVQWPRWPGHLVRRVVNTWRGMQLRARISQLHALQARPDLWAFTDDEERERIDARLASLYCQLDLLDKQAEAKPCR